MAGAGTTAGGGRRGAWALGALLGVLWLSWATIAAAVFATFVMVAWDDRGEASAEAPQAAASATPTATPAPSRPAGVPATAELVTGDLALGPPLSGAGAERLLFHIGCEDGLLAVVTTRESVYAEAPCAQAPSRTQINRMLGDPVRIEIGAGTLVLESAAVGRFAIDTASAWVDAQR